MKDDPCIPHLDPSSFTYRRYSKGSIHEIINGPCRSFYIKSSYAKSELRRYSEGWCYSEELYVEPKKNNIVVLCFKNNHYLWFHIREDEFAEVFCK